MDCHLLTKDNGETDCLYLPMGKTQLSTATKREIGVSDMLAYSSAVSMRKQIFKATTVQANSEATAARSRQVSSDFVKALKKKKAPFTQSKW